MNWKELKCTLSDDPVLKMLRPKLIGSLSGPVSAPGKTTSLIDTVRALTQLLGEAGFTLGDFDADELFDFGQDRITDTTYLLLEKLIPLVGLRETIDKPRIDDHKEYLTGSSQYASAESEVMSDESMDMRRMSLGPTGATFLRDQIASIKTEPTPVIAPVITNNMSLGQMQKLFTGAMEKFMKEQRQIKSEDRMGRSQNEKTSQDFSDVEMESVGLRHDQPNEYDLTI